ncbi:hypothetical protein ABNX41_16995, partial [Rhodobacteraceae bacterium PA1-206B]
RGQKRSQLDAHCATGSSDAPKGAEGDPRRDFTAFTCTRPVQPGPKLGAWAGELNRLLEVNAARASRERQSLAQIDEEPSGLGYGGGYDAVRRNASNRARNQGSGASAAFAPLRFAPGAACQFDWSHGVVVIDGARTIKAAHVRLRRSRTFFARADPRATQEPPAIGLGAMAPRGLRCSTPTTGPSPSSRAPITALGHRARTDGAAMARRRDRKRQPAYQNTSLNALQNAGPRRLRQLQSYAATGLLTRAPEAELWGPDQGAPTFNED